MIVKHTFTQAGFPVVEHNMYVKYAGTFDISVNAGSGSAFGLLSGHEI